MSIRNVHNNNGKATYITVAAIIASMVLVPVKKIYQTDIAIANPTNQTIIFPPTSSVVIGVNGIMPGVPGG